MVMFGAPLLEVNWIPPELTSGAINSFGAVSQGCLALPAMMK